MRGRMELIRAGCLLARKGLAPAASGNLSQRVSPRVILITRAGAALGSLTLDDIVEMDEVGNTAGDAIPSSEWRLHTAIYRETTYTAVLHCHPPALIATTMECDIWRPPTRECSVSFPEIRVVEHPGPNLLDPRPAVACLRESGVVMLRAHGLVLAGNHIVTLVHVAETLEHAARVSLGLRSVTSH
ncbi:MAG: class II aldolase/adducin family protein [bacterium JZ-2024 1]